MAQHRETSTAKPPTIDAVAAQRWSAMLPKASPWLHEEIGRRMQERLEWIKLQPKAWASWGPLRSGMAAHQLVRQTYPNAACQVVEHDQTLLDAARVALQPDWWKPNRWLGPAIGFGEPGEASVDMLWSNMGLHAEADPESVIRRWHRALSIDGFLMFSCFGPDTLRELRDVYALLGWPPCSHEFTDMHDWGDMLVQSGFAEPVMDMERITLTYEQPQRLLQELREVGRNLHPERAAGLRGRGWKKDLELALSENLPKDDEGRMMLSFEIIYGHALKPQPRPKVASESLISVNDMRAMLRRPQKSG